MVNEPLVGERESDGVEYRNILTSGGLPHPPVGKTLLHTLVRFLGMLDFLH